ncbi:MAG: 3-isopropylmalate/(R)-2-methylmalate dehydratase small subunit [Clostridia bacterium]|jgi:3-isopropylmalate/(R)-2-methylmalate dehydratase small subunit|nr:3-isopropylmalate dehydratase, small subunit [Clostridiales bacterium]MDK2985903.1 3-isopropylmalate/(R)-2-methylmalate dehydratase small subunit [Clostridia bacterium]
MKIKGIARKFPKDVDTDAIIPARYLNTQDEKELGKHCMEGIRPGFYDEINTGDIIMADTNFGCGSSREHAPIAIKGAGIKCVVAKSFARIFYRNCINIGLPVFECSKAFDESDEGDVISIDLENGVIYNETKNLSFEATPLPEFVRDIINAGGLTKFAKKFIK